jgi:protein involved in polysaccharide export with SLBB domain
MTGAKIAFRRRQLGAEQRNEPVTTPFRRQPPNVMPSSNCPSGTSVSRTVQHCLAYASIALACSVVPVSAAAQTAADTSVARFELEAAARAAESAGRTSEATLLRARLVRGDFQEGDRIVVVIEGNPPLRDTMRVGAEKTLTFPRMGSVSLEGVLRADLTSRLRDHLARYLRNPDVRATPLVPLVVLGSVQQPGFVHVQPDHLLRDVIMKAGGPTGDADLRRTSVRRGSQTIWDAASLQAGLAGALSVDRLHLQAGDEIFVPQRRRFQLSTVLTVLSATAALSVAAIQIQQR